MCPACLTKSRKRSTNNLWNRYYAELSVVDPYVFGPPGSGTVIICTNRDPSINKQKSYKKTLISTIFVSFKTDVNVPLKST
jgi:hypothetical protein